MPATESAPQQQKEGKSLSSIFNDFAADAVQRFPALKGRLLVVDMNESIVYGANDIDQKATGLTKKTAAQYMAGNSIFRAMQDDEDESSLAHHNKSRKLDIIFINERIDADFEGNEDPDSVTKDTEEHLLFVMDHELAHSGIENGRYKDSTLSTQIMAESIADAYGLIRHYQRFGINDKYRDIYVDPLERATDLMRPEAQSHFTTFVLDEITKRKDLIDFSRLDPAQTAALARRFALQYTPPEPVIKDLYKTFGPFRRALKTKPEESVKALIAITLNPESDGYAFKLGNLLLTEFLKTRTLPNGKPTTLPKEYLDEVSKKLKERELKFAQEDILFNVPVVTAKPQATPAKRAAHAM